MSKRAAECDGGNATGQPPQKKVQFEPVRIGPISTLEEMDIKVLQFQNKKLAQVRYNVVSRLIAKIKFLFLSPFISSKCP